MGYLAVWKVLEKMILNLKRRGVSVPAYVLNDLKTAKTLINILRADPSRLETSQKIEEQLQNLEAFLISKGQEKIGDNYVNEWMKYLEEAYTQPDEEVEEVRFIPGTPKEQKWIRIKPSEDMPSDIIETLAGELGLLVEKQKDGCLLVYGENGLVKDFVKMMAKRRGWKIEK